MTITQEEANDIVYHLFYNENGTIVLKPKKYVTWWFIITTILIAGGEHADFNWQCN